MTFENDKKTFLMKVDKSKKGEIDERRAAISVLEDWHKGKIRL